MGLILLFSLSRTFFFSPEGVSSCRLAWPPPTQPQRPAYLCLPSARIFSSSVLFSSGILNLVCSSPEVVDEVLGVLGMASKSLNLIGSSCHWRIPRFLSFETPAVDSRTAGSRGGSTRLRGSPWPRRLGNWVNIAYEKEAARAQWHRPMLQHLEVRSRRITSSRLYLAT